METIRLIGRNSRLSLLQMEIVQAKIEQAFPGIQVELIGRSSRGDELAAVPLHTVEGQDFFTSDIFNALHNGEADIAVHSLKDMSGEHFFGSSNFALVDRDDTRDLAIFNPGVIEKIQCGLPVVIGTCSPRREEMATVFLKKALPQLHTEINIVTKPIRGNVETRLRKLDIGEFDATILATAGLNRLLRSQKDAPLVKQLLAGKKLMLLPLVECVPAPCQGAIVAEALPLNQQAVRILKTINNQLLLEEAIAEKKAAIRYGTGCLQKFGVTTIHTKHARYSFAAGRDSGGTAFNSWNPWPSISVSPAEIFSSTDRMRDFFTYEWRAALPAIKEPVVFIANYKLLDGVINKQSLKDKTILASGTKTWFELARQGYWVTAGADAMGFEFLLPSLSMPILNIQPADILVLTHEAAACRWQKKGYNVAFTYKLIPVFNPSLFNEIATAKAICWSSFAQYQAYGHLAQPGIVHICAGGETASQLKQAGVDPVIFPTIKAFELWRKLNTPSHNVA